MAIDLLTPRTALRQMQLRGVRVHNLKNLNLDIPLDRLVVISGVSGSGKSSLAFDTLFAEGQRRFVESFSIAARQHLERFDRPDADLIAHVPPAIAIRNDRVRLNRHDGRSTVATVADLMDGLRLLFARIGKIVCPACQTHVRSNSVADVVHAMSELPAGTRCQLGFVAPPDRTDQADPASLWLARGYSRAIWDGTSHDLNTKPSLQKTTEAWLVVDRFVSGKTTPDRIAESAEVAMREGAGQCWLLVDSHDNTRDSICQIDGHVWKRISFNRRLICNGCQREFLPIEPRLFSHLSSGACLSCRGTGRHRNSNPDSSICTACAGTRFRDEALAVQIANHSIGDLCARSVREVTEFIQRLNNSLTASEQSLTELIRADLEQRLIAVCELGLDFLTLDRAAETLSASETRRLMLAAAIGSKITGMLVVVDEPSAGLAESEIPLVISALRKLQRQRNSVITVEHSPEVVAAADYLIELGPGAGPTGGSLIYQGPPIEPPPIPTDPSGSRKTVLDPSTPLIRLTRVQHRNLRNASFEFLQGKLNVVSGPGGNGKTTLVTEVLYPAIHQKSGLKADAMSKGTCEFSGGEGLVDVVLIDQSPLTKSSRSNPATWLDVFDEIRQTFAATMDARQRGFTIQHFSFNSASGGRCRACQGTGLMKQEMQFLPDVTLTCPECGGTRYRREILEVKYRGRSIADVLAMSVAEATVFFRSQTRVQYRFQLLKQIGLDYLVLGQPSETLSGGEAQRLKLAARLAIPNRGPSLIVCDEPTTGLHPADVARLISCFQEFTANGHTLVMADNSPELLSAADHIIELGG